MAQISIVKKSELEGAMRLDAEYYQPKYLGTVRTLQALGAVPLSNVAKPVKRRFTPTENLFNYIEIAEVDIGSGATNDVEIAGMEAPSRAQWIVREGDVIVSTVRPARNAVALIGSSEDGFVCSSGFIVLRPFKTSAEFLFAYLKTSIVASLLDRKTTATMYPAVSWDDVLSLPVVLPDSETQRFVSDKVKKSRQKLKDSDSLYLQAEQLLLDEFGFKDLDLSHQLYYTVPYKKAKEVSRLDAEHFQPRYEQLISHLATRVEVKPLGSFLLGVKKGIEVGGEHYQEKGKLFIRVSNLSVDGFVDRDQKYISEKLYDDLSKDFEPKVRELLLTKDATPGIAYVVKEPIEGIISSGILKLMIDETAIDKEYLALCINSAIGKLQIERDGGGSVITHWKPEQVKRLKIPALDARTQKEIASLVQQSHEARRKARQLLEEAKRKVEDLIEG